MREKMQRQSERPSSNVIARRPRADEAIPQTRSLRPIDRPRDDAHNLSLRGASATKQSHHQDGELVQKEIPKQTVSLSALAPRPVKKIDGRPQQKSKSGEIKENEKIEI